MEPLENAFQSIVRELKEELEIDVTPLKEVLAYDFKNYRLIFIECKLNSQTIILKEHLAFKWINPFEFKLHEFLEGDNNFIKTLTPNFPS